MKARLVITIVMMALCARSYAQDIIHTLNGAPIEAKVLEISDDYIRYKTFDNLDGPDYRIATVKVARIVFQNGTEKIFSPTDLFSPRLTTPYYDDIDRYSTYGPLVYRHGHLYDSRAQLRDYLGVSLYGSDYLKAKDQITIGSVLTVFGSSDLLFSIFCGMARADVPKEFDGASDGGGLFVVMGAIGVACLCAGIPLWVKGNRKMGAIADDYNRRYGPKDSPTLSLGPTSSGLGLALTF